MSAQDSKVLRSYPGPDAVTPPATYPSATNRTEEQSRLPGRRNVIDETSRVESFLEQKMPAETAPQVSIILMAYNESATTASVLQEIESVLGGMGVSYEVIAVDDGSDDDTGGILDAYAKHLPCMRVVHHTTNEGIGEVYRSGFSTARGEYLTFLPADGQFPASVIARFVQRMQGADVVLGHIGEVRRSLVGTLLSKGERMLYRTMFGPLPPFQGIMMFRRHLLDELGIIPGGRGWGILMEIIVRARRAGKVLVSEATPLRARASGTSKVNNFRSVRANLVQALRLWRTL
jgi:glycosyltransferase involved in cell wall biosynthesis